MNTIVRYEFENGVAMEIQVDDNTKGITTLLLHQLYEENKEYFDDSPIINIELRKGHGL